MQLNDTHPSIAVAELMRLLVDEHQMDWDKAWDITQKTLAIPTTRCCRRRWRSGRCRCLPAFCRGTWRSSTRSTAASSMKCAPRFPGDNDRIARMSLIDEHDEKYVRMANLATVGSHAVNGVAELHSELLKKTTLHDFYEFSPEKFLQRDQWRNAAALACAQQSGTAAR